MKTRICGMCASPTVIETVEPYTITHLPQQLRRIGVAGRITAIIPLLKCETCGHRSLTSESDEALEIAAKIPSIEEVDKQKKQLISEIKYILQQNETLEYYNPGPIPYVSWVKSIMSDGTVFIPNPRQGDLNAHNLEDLPFESLLTIKLLLETPK